MKHFFIAIASILFAVACKQPAPATVAASTPLKKVMDGNARFAAVHPIHPDESANRTHEIAEGQHPFAVVIACSDSRVAPELIFDEGLGDLFVIRTAGNIISEVELGSVEYAVEHLHVPLVIVMGHERCGAVEAMLSGALPHNHIKSIIDSLRNESEIKAIPVNDEQRLAHCVEANVRHGVKELLTQSTVIQEALHNGKLQVVGAHYDLDDRKVRIITEQ
ncbi:MAG: carbonic anhydrase [Chitinophagaceae bacterium]|nr:carbonic anhydrase [Chitinophagaceae bacterium]